MRPRWPQRRMFQTRRSMPRRAGVALLDAILGGVILGIGLTVLVSLSSRSIAAQNDGERQVVASWLADEMLNMVLVDGPVDFPRRNDVSGMFGEPFQDYAFEVAIEDVGLDLPYRVTATVRWAHGRTERFVQVQTLMAAHEQIPLPRVPAEPVDREDRWYGEESANVGTGR
jgi:hypothetical protein